MLLINLIKRASVNSSVVKSGKYLMLFLFCSCSAFLFLLSHQFTYAQNSSHYNEPIQTKAIHLNVTEITEDFDFNKIHKQSYVTREVKAEQGVIIQKRNFKIIGILSLVLMLVLIGFIVFKQHQFNTVQFEKEKELKEAYSIIESQKTRLKENETILYNCCNSIKYCLNSIITSIDDILHAHEIKDKRLIEKLTSINEFATHSLIEFTDNQQLMCE
jgi:hypothetical protein